METLLQEDCTSFSIYQFPLSGLIIQKLKLQVPNWHIKQRFWKRRLVRTFRFQSFNQALAFTQKVGKVATEQGHYPVLLIESVKVTVAWWTSGIRGLHRNDFIMAAKTNSIFENKEDHSISKNQNIESNCPVV